MPELSDILIVIIAIVSSGIFYFLWTEKLYRFYFGIIMWFLLFLVFNLQVKLFEVSGWISWWWEEFLVWNKNFVLWFFSIMIPVFWFLFAFLDWDLKSNKLFSLLFGFFLPLFLLWLFWYILLNSAINLDFLNNVFWFFNNSYIFDLLQKAPKIIFGLLIIIIFWKIIFRIIISFLAYISKLLLLEIQELRWERKLTSEEEK
jgi:hypothetical protein